MSDSLHGGLSCEPVQEKLYAYAQDGLSEAERGAVAAHLEGCASCREDLEALGEIDRLLRRTLGEHQRRRESAVPQVMRRIEEGMSKSMRRLSRRHIRAARPSRKPLVAAAALAAMLVLLLFLVFSNTQVTIDVSGGIEDPQFKWVEVYVDGSLYRTVELVNGKFTIPIPVTAGEVIIKSTDEDGNQALPRVIRINRKKRGNGE